MTKRLHCRRCRRQTDHSDHLVDVFGNPVRGVTLSRCLTFLATAGMSEILSEQSFECLECGRVRT